MPARYLLILIILPMALPGFLVGQVVDPQERQNDLERMERVLLHPGERDAEVLELSTDIFYPPFLFEMGPSPREVLRQFSQTLSIVAVVRRTGASPIVRFEGIGLVREGEEVSFTYEGETHEILFSEITDSTYTLSYNEETLRIEL
ncbi:MAG: hypothetical protein LAT55_03000 [Opitutales bacterium]|nr:hypothetical protein [Opitutales bacterium]